MGVLGSSHVPKLKNTVIIIKPFNITKLVFLMVPDIFRLLNVLACWCMGSHYWEYIANEEMEAGVLDSQASHTEVAGLGSELRTSKDHSQGLSLLLH